MSRVFWILISLIVSCTSTPHHKKTFEQMTLNDLLSSARMDLYPSNKTAEGYQLTNLMPESSWERFGFEEGDVITKVDGRSVLEPGANLDVLRAVLTPGAPIEVLRKGEYILLPTTSANPK